MGRIEAPIFEGDETFSKNYFDNLKLNGNNDNDKFLEKCYRDRCLKIISYSRLINSKWSSKGIIPLEMSLYSHNKLQKVYSEFNQNGRNVLLDINFLVHLTKFFKVDLVHCIGATHAMLHL